MHTPDLSTPSTCSSFSNVFFSAVSMGYCLVFSRGLRYFVELVLKFPPVNLFHQHPCLVRDLVMVHL